MNENLDPTSNAYDSEELDLEKKLRPLSFDDFAGQDQILENLKVLCKLQIKEMKHLTIHFSWSAWFG
jgi:Holliday junction resolvasome RuvABC ATP-dependent DNA helicase subunit